MQRNFHCEMAVIHSFKWTAGRPSSVNSTHSTLPSRTLGKLSFFQSPLEDLRECHGLLKATPLFQSASVLKRIHIFGSETKLMQDVRHCNSRLLSLQRVIDKKLSMLQEYLFHNTKQINEAELSALNILKKSHVHILTIFGKLQ